jgi:putative intracellular protease/amidase
MAEQKRKVLFAVTSHDRLGDTGRKTGFHFEELSTPYYILSDAGFEVVIASIAGGEAKADPNSVRGKGKNPESVDRFLADAAAMARIKNTPAVAEVNIDDFEGVYLPGGHGTMWDFPSNEALGRLIAKAYEQGKVVGTICHGTAGLIAARRGDGRPLVEGLAINSFTDAEEKAVGLAEAVPFLLESRLRELGARFKGADNFQPMVVRDGNLVTGQNPRSAEPLGRDMLALLERRGARAAE